MGTNRGALALGRDRPLTPSEGRTTSPKWHDRARPARTNGPEGKATTLTSQDWGYLRGTEFQWQENGGPLRAVEFFFFFNFTWIYFKLNSLITWVLYL